ATTEISTLSLHDALPILGDNRIVHRRDFGDDTNDENPVVGAEVSGDGMLNLRVVFPKFNNQTREYGLMRQPDGTMRTMYNHDEKIGRATSELQSRRDLVC